MWRAYDQISPLGGHAHDTRLAYLLATLVQVQTGGKPRRPGKPDLSRTPYPVADFLLRWGAAAPPVGRTSTTPVYRGQTLRDVDQVFQAAGIVGRPG